MAQEELQAIADEVAAEEAVEAEAAAQAEAEAEPSRELRAADDAMALLLGAVVKGVGNVICVRAGVSPLSDGEVSQLGAAFANVVAQYDIGDLDPRTAAWLGAGIAVGAVALPRLDEYQRAQAMPFTGSDGAGRDALREEGGAPDGSA